jgi:hypothetical protein
MSPPNKRKQTFFSSSQIIYDDDDDDDDDTVFIPFNANLSVRKAVRLGYWFAEMKLRISGLVPSKYKQLTKKQTYLNK